uniref:Uncharacterized protein n=1 Tax=Acrobeloides nanus TaxID=290746 RepID=A0A914CIS6_9BILA
MQACNGPGLGSPQAIGSPQATAQAI